MRIKVGDPFSEECKVMLDGKEVDCAVEACEETGYVKRIIADAEGFAVLKDDQIQYEDLHGKVELCFESPSKREACEKALAANQVSDRLRGLID